MKKISISVRLSAYFLAAGLGSLLLLGLVIRNYADKAVTESTSEQLIAVREVKKNAVEDYFGSVESRLRQLARNPGLRNALIEYDSAFQKGVNTPEYEQAQIRYGDYLIFLEGQNDFSDLLLVNVSGDAVWTAKRAQDFATNFSEGVFSRENIATAFRNGRREFSLTDFAPYAPAEGLPQFFAAAPVRSGNKLHGVIIASLSAEKLQQICRSGNAENSSVESVLIGDDFLMRTDSRFSEGINLLKTQVKNPMTVNGLAGKSGIVPGKSYRSEEVLSAYTQVKYRNLRFVLLVEKPLREMADSLAVLNRITFMFCIIFSGIVLFLGYFLHKKINFPLKHIHQFVRKLAKGDIPANELPENSADEIAELNMALNQTAETLRKIADLAEKIAEGKVGTEFEDQSLSGRLGLAMNDLQKKLRAEKDNLQKRERLAEGLAVFSELLRTDQIDDMFYDRLLAQLVKFSGANQGTIYIHSAKENVLKMRACYAFDRKKFEESVLRPGENMVGQVFLEQKPLQTDDIPPNYIRITSGLGDAAPGHLLLVPLNVGSTCCGVVELASFKAFSAHETDFVISLSENIGRTIISVGNKVKSDRLLSEVQEQARDLRAKEAKMRHAIEELQSENEGRAGK